MPLKHLKTVLKHSCNTSDQGWFRYSLPLTEMSDESNLITHTNISNTGDVESRAKFNYMCNHSNDRFQPSIIVIYHA